MWLFFFATIGLTNILISSEIMEPVDAWAKRWLPKSIYHAIFECYQCCGFWSGVFMGILLFGFDPFALLMTGCAGSYLADTSETLLGAMENQHEA
jgi:hypothetical protein